MIKCEIPGCRNDGVFYRELNIRLCDECYDREVPTCDQCKTGIMVDNADVGGCKCNQCGYVEKYNFTKKKNSNFCTCGKPKAYGMSYCEECCNEEV